MHHSHLLWNIGLTQLSLSSEWNIWLLIASVLSSYLISGSSEGEAQPEDDATGGMAVIFSVVTNAGGGVGVAYANTAFRNLGLLQFEDTEELKDLEGMVVQVSPDHTWLIVPWRWHFLDLLPTLNVTVVPIIHCRPGMGAAFAAL